jgi:hypothetical protein
LFSTLNYKSLTLQWTGESRKLYFW